MTKNWIMEKDGDYFVATSQNTDALVDTLNRSSFKDTQKDLLEGYNKWCQVCFNEVRKREGLEPIPLLEAPEVRWLKDNDAVQPYYYEQLDKRLYPELEAMLIPDDRRLTVNFCRNAIDKQSSVGHKKNYKGFEELPSVTAEAIIKDLREDFPQFEYDYELIKTTYYSRKIIIIYQRYSSGKLYKRFFIYEKADGTPYFLAIQDVLNRYLKNDGVQNRIIFCSAVISKANCTGELMLECVRRPFNFEFIHRKPSTIKGGRNSYPHVGLEDLETISVKGTGSSVSKPYCTTDIANKLEQETGMRKFPSRLERLNHASLKNDTQSDKSLLFTEFNHMSNDELQSITDMKHPAYFELYESNLAAAILEERKVDHDDRLLSTIAHQLKEFEYTDSSEVREVNEDNELLKARVDDSFMMGAKEAYAAIGLEHYLKASKELTFAEAVTIQKRIERVTALLYQTQKELLSEKFAHLHFNIQSLGQHLWKRIAAVSINDITSGVFTY